MDGQRADGLRQNPNTRPHRRQREAALLRDGRAARFVGHHVGGQSLIHGGLELRRAEPPLATRDI